MGESNRVDNFADYNDNRSDFFWRAVISYVTLL